MPRVTVGERLEMTLHEKHLRRCRESETWTNTRFGTDDLSKVYEWIQINATARFSLSIMSVRFENPKDATFFKLSFRNV